MPEDEDKGMPIQAALALAEKMQSAYPNVTVAIERYPNDKYWILASYCHRDISDRFNTFQLFTVDSEEQWGTWAKEFGVIRNGSDRATRHAQRIVKMRVSTRLVYVYEPQRKD